MNNHHNPNLQRFAEELGAVFALEVEDNSELFLTDDGIFEWSAIKSGKYWMLYAKAVSSGVNLKLGPYTEDVDGIVNDILAWSIDWKRQCDTVDASAILSSEPSYKDILSADFGRNAIVVNSQVAGYVTKFWLSPVALAIRSAALCAVNPKLPLIDGNLERKQDALRQQEVIGEYTQIINDWLIIQGIKGISFNSHSKDAQIERNGLPYIVFFNDAGTIQYVHEGNSSSVVQQNRAACDLAEHIRNLPTLGGMIATWSSLLNNAKTLGVGRFQQTVTDVQPQAALVWSQLIEDACAANSQPYAGSFILSKFQIGTIDCEVKLNASVTGRGRYNLDIILSVPWLFGHFQLSALILKNQQLTNTQIPLILSSFV